MGESYAVNPVLLKNVAEAMFKLGAKEIELRVPDTPGRPAMLTGKNAQGAMTGLVMPLANTYGSERAIHIAPDKPVSFSRAIVRGKHFVLLDKVPQQHIDWKNKNAVRKYLTTLVGTGAVSLSDGKRLEIGRELPREYTRSDYAEKAFRNKRLRKLRAKTAQQLDELIVESGNRTPEPARDKSREDGVYYKRQVSFGVMSHEVARGYSGELVTYTENGEEICMTWLV